ncbi:hypothetical protein BDE02_11G037000 [Populus trichocarpa]|nr:hypothetical protein BDE02_11G037000 [Populus trichocarpa]
MMSFRSWKLLKRNYFDGVKFGLKMKQLPFMGFLFTTMLFIVYRTTTYQYKHTEMEEKLYPFDSLKESALASGLLVGLPHGIIRASSDLELKPLWSTSSSRSKADPSTRRFLLAIPVGIKQKDNVNRIVQKFLPENFTVILFHYDGKVDGWWDLDWSNEVIHIAAKNQTKWWFAKRFLHPAVVSIYDYIFLWDEDLGVEHFNPGRFVEGMAPVFSRSAWYCAWHLIQNDLVHGWGMDMKLGYCAQGDRTKKVGVVDSEYIVHKGIQTLGGHGPPGRKASNTEELTKRHSATGMDPRMEIRRQSTWELQIFKDRWNQAVKEDKNWVDPFLRKLRLRNRRQNH